MGFRAAVTNLAVAVLLGCPYVCLAEVGAARAEAEHPQQSCCNCCGPNEPAQDQPGGNDSGSGPRCCICGGALVEAPARTEAPDAEIVTPLADHETLLPPDLVAASHRGVAHWSPPFPPPCWGRLLRVLIDSLLL